jgi:hypothetical protein
VLYVQLHDTFETTAIILFLQAIIVLFSSASGHALSLHILRSAQSYGLCDAAETAMQPPPCPPNNACPVNVGLVSSDMDAAANMTDISLTLVVHAILLASCISMCWRWFDAWRLLLHRLEQCFKLAESGFEADAALLESLRKGYQVRVRIKQK